MDKEIIEKINKKIQNINIKEYEEHLLYLNLILDNGIKGLCYLHSIQRRIQEERNDAQKLLKNNSSCYKIRNLKEKVKIHKQANIKYGKYIEDIEKYRKNIGKKIFVSSVTQRGMLRSYTGILKSENKSHITIIVSDQIKEWEYVIRKDNIDGIKYYG